MSLKSYSKNAFENHPKGLHVERSVCDSRLFVSQHMLKEDDMFKDFAARSPSASITDEDSNVWS